MLKHWDTLTVVRRLFIQLILSFILGVPKMETAASKETIKSFPGMPQKNGLKTKTLN